MLNNKFKISLLENGLSSITKGIEYLNEFEKNSKDLNNLKFGIKTFHNGIELLFKAVLVNKFGEKEIIDTKDKKLELKYNLAEEQGLSVFEIKSPAKTINFNTLLSKINENIGIDDNLKKLLEELQAIRNGIEHYGIDRNIEDVEILLLNLKTPILDWFVENDIKIPDSFLLNWNSLQQVILETVFRLRGGTFIKDIFIKDEYLEFTYLANYRDYILYNTYKNLTEEQCKLYWETGNAKIKALNDGCVRMLRRIPKLNTVKIRLIDSDYIYSIVVNREEIEQFLNSNFSDIDKYWDDIFSNKYVYNKDLSLVFFNHFGTKESINK